LAFRVDGEFEKRNAVEPRSLWRIEQRDTAKRLRRARLPTLRRSAHQALSRLRLQIQQRLHRIDRRAAAGSLPEHIIENLEREWAGIAGDQHMLQKAGQNELALARKAAVMAAPLQDVHREPRRIRELQEEYLVARDFCDACRIIAERQRMKAVE